MKLKLPSLQDSRCQSLTLCARVGEDDERLLEAFGEERHYTAAYTTKNGRKYLEFSTGGDFPDHMHILIATADHFRGKMPADRDELGEVLETMGLAQGRTATVLIHGVYEMAWDELPASGLVRTMQVEAVTDGYKIKLDGAKVCLEDGPVNGIDWVHIGDGKVRIELSVFRELPVDPDLLIHAFEYVETPFARMILGRREMATR